MAAFHTDVVLCSINVTGQMRWSTMSNQVERMLDDIRSEVRYTRHMIGRDELAPEVMEAMRVVSRKEFVPKAMQPFAYDNGPLSIGYGQTISQPYIVALMTDLLGLEAGHVVLEIGTGSGYQTAILSRLASKVYSVELIGTLGEQSRKRLERLKYDNIETRIGNGYEGWPEHAPYDAIIVTAAASHIPVALLEQLKPGGRMTIPVGLPHSHQELMLVEKDNQGETRVRKILDVAFVPLVADPSLEHEHMKT